MKKFLLFLMMLVAVLTATAQEVTGNAMDKFGTATISSISEFNVAPVTLTFAKNGGSNDPAYNKAGDCRIYAKNTITAACTTGNLTKIVFTISAQGKKRLTDLTPSVGTVTIAEDHSTITWEGNATEVVMTVGEKAVYGTDGDSKAGQICFTEFTATYEAGSATAAAAPSLPADCSFTESKTIEITNNEEGATVYYTTDGENFNEYVGEFTINETTTVIAYAQIGDDVATKSFEVERTYTKLEAKTIAEVIEAGEGEAYTKGTVVATYAKGFLLNDETGYILVYQGNAPTVAEGDVININGTTSMYGGLLQFAAGANIEKTGTAEVTHPEAVVMDGAAFDAFLTAPEVKYVEYIGTLTINGNYYNVAVEGAETAIASIQYPNDGLVTVESGEVIKVTGYTIGYNKSYVNTMAVKVEAYVEPAPEPEPEVTANAISLAFTRTGTNGESVSVVAVNENGETLENVSVAVATTVDFRPTAGSITEAILCPNVNGNAGADIEMTFTLSNLPEGFSFNNVGLDIHALNGGNGYQQNNDNKKRQWNVAVAANDAVFGSLTDIDIASGIGESGVSVHKVWTVEGAAVESAENSVVIKLNVTSGTLNEGCFFGLSEIQLTTVEVVEPETPFEVVAVTPNEAVAELSTITVEFSEEIAGTQDVMAMETIYVGSKQNACNFTVEGKVLTITLWTPITAAGEYALKVPAGVGITRVSNGEAVVIDGEITFTVEEPAAPFEVVAVTPAEAVTELSTITVEFSEEIAGTQDVMAMETIYVGSKQNACNFTVEGKVLTITLWTPITTPGEYALKVPAGVGITRVSNGEAVVIDGEITFTVEEAVVEPEPFDWAGTYVFKGEPTSKDGREYPAEFEVVVEFVEANAETGQEEMYLVTSFMGNDVNAINYGGIELTIAEDGKSATLANGNVHSLGGGNFLKLFDADGAANPVAITLNEDGTLTMADFTVVMGAWGNNENNTLMAEYKNNTLVKGELPEPEPEPETFALTADLYPAVEGDITEIRNIRVQHGEGASISELPTTWTLTNEAGDSYEISLDWGLINFDDIFVAATPAITEAGTYTLTIPAGSLTTDNGKVCEAATFSWTVVGPVDPYMPYNNGTRTNTGRVIKGITLTGASGVNSYALTENEQTQDYTDATAVAVFKVAAGEELTITFDKMGEWIHQYVFIDYDGDGFTASIEAGSSYAPAEDLVAYSFYNNNDGSDALGWNSVGDMITGDNRSTPAVPAFNAPTEVGTYRMRVKQDWCNIDPAGDADGKFGDFKANGGQIIDVILEVVEATTGIENVEAETVKAIYDITGRKIEKITEGGIYIINGKKVLVK